jgi:hypothetical protein
MPEVANGEELSLIMFHLLIIVVLSFQYCSFMQVFHVSVIYCSVLNMNVCDLHSNHNFPC